MKAKYLIMAVVLFVSTITAKAQFVKVKISYPVGIGFSAPGRPPYSGAVWIGPEWIWRNGSYQCVKGYWDKPRRHGAKWISGFWKYSRRGYSWIPGRWN